MMSILKGYTQFVKLAAIFTLLLMAGCAATAPPTTGLNTKSPSTKIPNTATTSVRQLDWNVPTMREDNSALSFQDIAGYKIYYGTSPGKYPHSVNVNASDASGVISQYSLAKLGLSSGKYYFTMTTLDTAGRESPYSNEVVVTI